jgi:quinol monooxygenase YgiN
MSDPSRPARPFNVMVRFSVSPADQAEFVEMVMGMMMEIGPFLASQPGFLGFMCHRSLDGATVVNHFQWQSQADHETCMAHPEMEAAGDAISEWLETGRAQLEIEAFELVSSIG